MKDLVKDGDIIFDGIHNRSELEKMAFKELEKIQTIFKKYSLKDVNELDKILQIQKFLNEHEYCTLPRDEFDLLFSKLDILEIIKNKRVNVEAFFYSASCEDYNKHYTHYEDLTQEEYNLLKEVFL